MNIAGWGYAQADVLVHIVLAHASLAKELLYVNKRADGDTTHVRDNRVEANLTNIVGPMEVLEMVGRR